MVEVKEEIIESRCGLCCKTCEYKDSMNCLGCTKIPKPFWGDKCDVKSCCENNLLTCCGECESFPCEILKSFAYAEKEGDNGERIKTCQKWCENNN